MRTYFPIALVLVVLGLPPARAQAVAVCGNGATEAPELCDDGNFVDGDGCDSNCTFTGCGNTIVTAGEECDDGNTVPGDCCSAICLSENSPPDCGDAAASVDELWPPNHKMTSVGIVGVTDPDGDPVSVIVTEVRQDEPLDATGDGETCPDGFACVQPGLGFGQSDGSLWQAPAQCVQYKPVSLVGAAGP